MVGAVVLVTALPRHAWKFVTTHPRSQASRSLHLGVRTTSGASQVTTLEPGVNFRSGALPLIRRQTTPTWSYANPAGSPAFPTSRYTQLAGYVEHVPTGLWGNFQWGHVDTDGYVPNDVYYAKAGIKLKLTSLGVTRPYGEYLRANDGIYDNSGNFTPGAHQTFYGGGVVQDIDAAAMQVWIRARVISADIPTQFTNGLGTEDFTGGCWWCVHRLLSLL